MSETLDHTTEHPVVDALKANQIAGKSLEKELGDLKDRLPEIARRSEEILSGTQKTETNPTS